MKLSGRKFSDVTRSPVPPAPPAEPAVVKRRKKAVKNNRLFNYRGVTFLMIIKGERTTLSTLNAGQQPENRIEVPSANAKLAMQELAKVVHAELALEHLGASQPKNN